MRRADLALGLAVLLAPALALAAAPASGYTSCRQRAQGPAFEATPERPAPSRALPTVEGDRQEADAFEEAVRRFDEEGRAYRGEVQTLVKKQFEERRRFLADNYEQAIGTLEVLERNERDAAILRFEEFLSRYPDDPQFTPDAMFRLAELYYEKANDDFRRQSV
jgi:TolA-binding protein